MAELRLFTVTDHDAVWPTGVASIVLAADRGHARRLLDAELARRGLKTSAERSYTLVPVEKGKPMAIILADGDY